MDPTEFPIIPHSDERGAEDCCGCLCLDERPDGLVLICNECEAIVARGEEEIEAYAQRFLGDPLTTTIDVCPHCGHLNSFPGWSQMLAYTCDGCGRGVNVRKDL